MKLEKLLSALHQDNMQNPLRLVRVADPCVEIGAIRCNGGLVKPGDLFVAMRGEKADGHDFIAQAVERGAVAVVARKPVELPEAVSLIVAEDSRRALGALAACFFGNPWRSLKIVGITGTNAKTTVSFLVESVLANAGFSAGVIGTVNVRFCNRVLPSAMTTPESLELTALLHEMRSSGVTHVVMEVSSHALAQGRVRFVEFDAGVFTNLSQDHLDYHENLQDYFACKRKLFVDQPPNRSKGPMAAVINRDDPFGGQLCAQVMATPCEPVICTGFSPESQIRGVDVVAGVTGVSGTVLTPDGDFFVRSPLVGRHNFENILSAAGACLALGLGLEEIKKGLEALCCVPGRLERVESNSGRHIFVDYCHTPQAVEKVLEALKAISPGRLITVLGCGGDRDRTKRPLMGAAAAKVCDLLVVTSDNPRTENPQAIIEQILPGVVRHLEPFGHEGSKGYLVEPDRAAAISLAVKASQPGDTLLIAGKGHEDYQIIGSTRRHFDDREEAKKALALVEGQSAACQNTGSAPCGV
ncbi:MAG: UDP-N-acetylmuramoyl-L-alanyl-D-glutamate--2,6-diaminopimelate ligase [Desulfatibacillaceae bacterium]|nr:UDP-N-acetylmuramoyl-L-alanyl-D-glutamate--2,6-diaminopimelate ligase [Desulfatibacillaceae bacterium]